MSSAPLRGLEDLLDEFARAEKPREAWRVGVESEKFGVVRATGRPLAYAGEASVETLFARLAPLGWTAESERPGGPPLSMARGGASITLEPGAQFELSGTPFGDVHAVHEELEAHVEELRRVAGDLGLAWLGVGFHPLAHRDELPWVPKARYPIMRGYLPSKGDGALDMMQRTATVQGNFDFSDEEDALRKLRVLLKLSPLLNAMTANSPFKEGVVTDLRSVRAEVWTRMDPSRAGLIESLWANEHAGYRDYAEWALDAGMFLFKRDGEVIANTGQTFRAFLRDGYAGHRATADDWHLHLGTLFPEVRLKQTLEVRSADSLPGALVASLPALVTGVLYDATALAEAEAMTRDWTAEELTRQRLPLAREGLRARLFGAEARAHAERLLDVASGGLARRARLDAEGRDERRWLEPLAALVGAGKTPADCLTEGLTVGSAPGAAELLRRCEW